MDGLKMKTGWRHHGAARLYIRQSTAVPLDLRPLTRELRSLETAAGSQQQGHATMLVRKVCAEADRHGVVLVLWPVPWGDNIAMSASELADWYSRAFGFEQLQDNPVILARPVGARPKRLKLNATIEALHADAK